MRNKGSTEAYSPFRGKRMTYPILVEVGEGRRDRGQVLPSKLESTDPCHWGLDNSLTLSWDSHDISR